MATLTVGTNKQYASLATALDAARDGDVVAVSSGVYLNDFGTIHTKVTLTAVGGKVVLLATQALAPGHAILTVTTDAVVDGFVFSGARSSDGTAAGLLDTGGALVVRNSLFTGDQNGLVVQASTAGTVLVQGSEFAGNGAGDGFSGNISVGAVASLTIKDSYIHDAKGGDEIRSLAKATTITGSRIVDSTAAVAAANGASGSTATTATATTATGGTVVAADINLPKAGTVVIQNTVIEKGPDAAGPAIRIGGDTSYVNSSITISGDTLVSDRVGAVAVQNTTTAVANISASQFYGFAAVASGLSVQSADTVPAVRPTVSVAALIDPATVPSTAATAAATTSSAAPTVTTTVAAPVTTTVVTPVTTGTAAASGITAVTAAAVTAVTATATTPATTATTTTVTTTPSTTATVAGAATAVAASLPVAVEYGRAGAVVANGTILTVGGSGQYATLGAALGAAHDGDTIRVAAGTYTDAGVTVSHKVIIEGVGGLARFVASGTPLNGLAQITTTTDVTLRNIEVSGATVLGGVAAGIRDAGGNLTLVNSFIHDNGAGLVADAGTTGSIGIYDTEFARNGTADGRGLNLDVAEVGTLTLRNDWIHDAAGGGEVRSRADNTVIDGTRVLQTLGSGAYAVDLPEGGKASIRNSVIEKGAGSLGGALVHVGGGTIHASSALTLSGNTLISDVTGAATRFVVAESGAGSLLATGTGFEGGAAGSVPVVNGTSTGASTVSGLSVAATVPWGAAGAPVAGALTVATPVAAKAVHGVLILRISEDAYQGNAKFTLSVDGVQVGDTLTATALHGSGQSQSFTIAGDFAPGAHVVGVTLVNDLSGASGGDRNLYVDGMGFNGENMHQTATLSANGTALLTTGAVTRQTPVTVNLSEDAWKGDAQAFISIDGKLQGGITTVTASHALGKTQAMSFLTDLSPGAHTVAVTYLNDAKGGAGEDRNLYIDSMDIAGVHYALAAATLSTNGASTFAFTVAPPAAANAGLFLTAGLPQAASLLVPLG